MKTIAALGCVLLIGEAVAPASIQGQGFLTGVVTDTLGHPLAAIVKAGTSTGTLADQSGAYLLRLSEGMYDVEVQHLGFEPHQSRHVEITAGDTIVHHVVMRPAPSPPQLVWLGCALDGLPAAAVCLDPRRVNARSLWVVESGQWVLQSRAEWEAFWDRYDDSTNGIAPEGEASEVNWDLNVLAVVGRGHASACGNWRPYINRILLYPDSTVVFVGPDEGRGELTCAAVVAPVDVVLVPRGYGAVKFRKVR